MATRVGLLDADSDVSDDDDTPLGVAGARRLAKRVDGDDFMDEDARDDAILDLYDSRATAEALRAHEDALEELRAHQTSTADAFGAFLSVDDGENEARALETDSNEARGDAVARASAAAHGDSARTRDASDGVDAVCVDARGAGDAGGVGGRGGRVRRARGVSRRRVRRARRVGDAGDRRRRRRRVRGSDEDDVCGRRGCAGGGPGSVGATREWGIASGVLARVDGIEAVWRRRDVLATVGGRG